MPKTIRDKFSDLNISRQQRYQLRRQARRQCRLCPEKRVKGKTLCAAHEASEKTRSQGRRKN